MPFKPLAAAGLFFSMLALPGGTALAEDFYWSHKDWQLTVEPVASEEDDHSICRAWTGGDGDPILAYEHYTGDAGPPYDYPLLVLTEYAPRHYDTLTQTGDDVRFVLDDGSSFLAAAEAGFTDEGLKEAHASPEPGVALALLQAMRRSDALTVQVNGQPLFQASMAGFSAVYGKMAEVCGFSTEGVLD